MRFGVVSLVVACVVAPAVGAVGASTVRAYPLPSGGSLELTVPMRWQEDIAWAEGQAWPKLSFRSAGGDDFVATVTALAPGAITSDAAHPDRVRNVVDRSARAALGIGPDKDLLLEEFDGPQGPGWFFSVVDPSVPESPPEGVFRVMTEGAIAVGDVLLAATVLTQKQKSADLDAAIDMLRTAHVSDRPGDAWRRPNESHRNRGGVGQRYRLDLPEGFRALSSSPLEARDEETGGILHVEVEMRRSRAKDELPLLEHRLDLRSPDGWISRHRGLTTVAGSPAAELIAGDEHRDEGVHLVAIPHGDFVLVVEWRVPLRAARLATPRIRAALDAIRFEDAGGAGSGH